MPTILGQNQYGKAENRVVKITRDGATHHIKDLNVSVALSGDMDEVHYSGSNANVLPTEHIEGADRLHAVLVAMLRAVGQRKTVPE